MRYEGSNESNMSVVLEEKAPRTDVHDAIINLGRELDELYEHITALENRLKPVLREDTEDLKGDDPAHYDPNISDVHRAIIQRAYVASYQARRIERLVSLLDV